MESRVSHEESAARPFTLSAEHVAVLRGKVEDEESVVYEHEWYELFDSHEALRSLLSDRDETIKALRADKERLDYLEAELLGSGRLPNGLEVSYRCEMEALRGDYEGEVFGLPSLREIVDAVRGVKP